ncbi:Ubiquinone biosynthesis O-methyltransferase [Candidatus Arsenophonus lipoptenae]|uniref:Ubiquinone biosynthesis O-methyltransferase n=1 Tax=Candidatus Arsenophonus lipoptenae TaxID=634113 RepID=A0A109QE57_9GAMM|nr:bifunctional 2-polyprenyl-6-hydroxyphenol methylase/3-demethylubiquinol 3-O-methyltransferase UbiG [Candidatus Arsenophonus lipoptenae]AMA64980.1 Ubiquinone biosynthesis O-methyltransferase [Candidatus Arsenophonus lipoptenae]
MKKKILIDNLNIDKTEINKFSSIAADGWDHKSVFQSLHNINPLRLNYIMHHANGLFGKKVLDIGCGIGILSESMALEGAIVTGIDMDTKSLAVARQHALKQDIIINYLQETVESHAKYYSKNYDIITCMEMLEHVPNPESIVRSCAKLVRSSGHVFFSTINRNKKSWFCAIIIAEHILKIIPKGTHNVKTFIRPSELLSWIDKTSLEERHIIGLQYNPIIDKFQLKSNVDINYILHLSISNND